MAHVIAGEAQFCDDAEQKYVGSVVLNRVAHLEYPDTIKGVVFEKKQYSSVADGNYNRKPTEQNWANAKWLLENGSVLPGYVVYQSKGKQGHGVYLKTKWHQYCY
jgi:N-acetylmuramoyl-L-alanine amidase